MTGDSRDAIQPGPGRDTKGMNVEPKDSGDGVNHLDAALLALYIDHRARADEADRVERHLSACADCRTEWMAAQSLVDRRPGPSVRLLLPLAAAATLVLLVGPGLLRRDPVHREPVVITSQAPGGIAPRGPVAQVPEVVWSLVPGADRYRVAVFDSAGRVLWEASTADTTVALPDSVKLGPGTAFFWRVHARTGYDRWVESSLVEFRIDTP